MTGGEFFVKIFGKYLIIRQILQTCEVPKNYLKPLWFGSQRVELRRIDLSHKNKCIAYCSELLVEIISCSSYINIYTMNIIFSDVGIYDLDELFIRI